MISDHSKLHHAKIANLTVRLAKQPRRSTVGRGVGADLETETPRRGPLPCILYNDHHDEGWPGTTQTHDLRQAQETLNYVVQVAPNA